MSQQLPDRSDTKRRRKEGDMENVKVSVSSRGQNGDTSAPSNNTTSVHARPTITDLHGSNHFAQVARDHWLGSTKTPKVRPEVVKKELWDELEAVDFAYSSLLVLENLQVLELYLWPGWSEEASNWHCLLLALVINVKRREGLESWSKMPSTPGLLDCKMKLTYDRSFYK
jgi:intron-binding protein aquarius